MKNTKAGVNALALKIAISETNYGHGARSAVWVNGPNGNLTISHSTIKSSNNSPTDVILGTEAPGELLLNEEMVIIE